MPANPSGLAVLNVACSMLSNFEPMRLFSVSFLIVALSTVPILAATPEIPPTPTVPAAAAEQGKDVVHQLNNAFAKVFETVAPSVVIIEISKKNDNETSAFEDLFFQGPPDENNPRRNQRLFDFGLFADRRVDQSRQQRRAALRYRRQGDRHEHADQWDQPWSWVRHSNQHGKRNRRRADRRTQDHAPVARDSNRNAR